MRYRIELRRNPKKQLDRITGHEYIAISKSISSLKHEPRPRGVEKLAESGLWRIRVGQYRVIYHIDDELSIVIIVRVARRTEDTYKRL